VRIAASLALGLTLLSAPPARAERRPLVYAIVVGNNDGLGMLPQLNYADDDALRFYDLATQLTTRQNVALLTELDVDTWRRIQADGAKPPPYLPPTRSKLLEVVRLFKGQIARVRRRDPGRRVHLYFFFSGHGERGYFFLKKKKSDRLAESAFTGTDLDRTFSDSEATLNALFIDACKSQSLFLAKGPRSPEDDELGPDFSGLIDRLDRTSRRAPIGVLTSTVSDKPAGEARDIRGGYFSHVLISGLRGAADANSDGVVRYGELAAFVSFHTRRIAGQRPWFRPPAGKLDAPLVELRARSDVLELPPGIGGHFAVFDGRGRDLVLEAHKTDAQWTRLILSPGRYKVVWITRPSRGLVATLDLSGRRRLMKKDFALEVALGPDHVPKGEGLGAPPDEEQALDAFDPARSGFDQPFTPRVVSALETAYNSGLSAVTRAPPGPLDVERNLVAAGYGLFAQPIDPLSLGQGVTLSYARRLRGWPLLVGGSAIFSFSEHESPTTGLRFRMRRLALQAEVSYARPLGRWLELFAGAYAGWQMVLLTRDVLTREGETERLGTVLNGDTGSFRTGLQGGFRFNIVNGLWIAASAGWGMDLVHEEDDAGESEAVTFLRPHFQGQVGYGF
jgi:hypothetical protein